jgi:hypothetical protein
MVQKQAVIETKVLDQHTGEGTMHIGKALRVLVVEPLQLPVNQAPRTSQPLPVSGAQPPSQPEPVPAK